MPVSVVSQKLSFTMQTFENKAEQMQFSEGGVKVKICNEVQMY